MEIRSEGRQLCLWPTRVSFETALRLFVIYAQVSRGIERRAKRLTQPVWIRVPLFPRSVCVFLTCGTRASVMTPPQGAIEGRNERTMHTRNRRCLAAPGPRWHRCFPTAAYKGPLTLNVVRRRLGSLPPQEFLKLVHY